MTFRSIIEDGAGNVVGCTTEAADVLLAENEIVPRSELRTVAKTLATKYGISIPEMLAGLVSPPEKR